MILGDTDKLLPIYTTTPFPCFLFAEHFLLTGKPISRVGSKERSRNSAFLEKRLHDIIGVSFILLQARKRAGINILKFQDSLGANWGKLLPWEMFRNFFCPHFREFVACVEGGKFSADTLPDTGFRKKEGKKLPRISSPHGVNLRSGRGGKMANKIGMWENERFGEKGEKSLAWKKLGKWVIVDRAKRRRRRRRYIAPWESFLSLLLRIHSRKKIREKEQYLEKYCACFQRKSNRTATLQKRWAASSQK